MCEYLKRMSPQDMPTDDIRQWSGLAHSVVEYTGPRPFGMDGSVYLWLHERSATQLLDMCDELDVKFSDLKSETAKLREQVTQLQDDCESERDYADQMEAKEKKAVDENAKLREMIRILHMAYVGATNECEGLDESLIWEFSSSIRKDVEKSKAKYEVDRHRFDAAMRELGIEVEDA